MGNIPLDFDTLQPYGCFIGSAAIIAVGQRPARDAALNMMKFFDDELRPVHALPRRYRQGGPR